MILRFIENSRQTFCCFMVSKKIKFSLELYPGLPEKTINICFEYKVVKNYWLTGGNGLLNFVWIYIKVGHIYIRMRFPTVDNLNIQNVKQNLNKYFLVMTNVIIRWFNWWYFSIQNTYTWQLLFSKPLFQFWSLHKVSRRLWLQNM